MARQKGQTVVEAALVLPVLLVMLMAVLSFGLMFSVELVITNACREGARFGTLGKSQSEITTKISNYLSNATLPPGTPVITVTGAGGASGTDVAVVVTYPVQLFIPVPGLPNPVNVQSQAIMRIE